MGRCFASEELLAHFLLEYPEAISATHLTSVVMHFWSTGQAVELVGEAPSMLWPPLYQGFFAGSHPLIPLLHNASILPDSGAALFPVGTRGQGPRSEAGGTFEAVPEPGQGSMPRSVS